MQRITPSLLRKTASPLLLVALLSAGAANAQVDLTPIANTYEFDGVKMSNFLFRDGQKQITYQPPADWRVAGSGTHLTVVPSAVANADAQVDVTPVIGAATPLNDANVQKYVEKAQRLAPQAAKKVTVLGAKLNPLKICGNDTLAVELQYDAFGTAYRSQVLFLSRADDLWVFRFTAPSVTFEKAFEPFRTSLYSITGL